jgi:hypothetical protein
MTALDPDVCHQGDIALYALKRIRGVKIFQDQHSADPFHKPGRHPHFIESRPV